jgi:methyl-accepting chemotaxis protein
LIQSTLIKINNGSAVVGKTSQTISKVADGASRMAELVGEIAVASNEQAQGIAQISTAVSEMDKVVQTNAANSEESASAAEEMSVQARTMKSFVASLETMVNGNGRQKEERTSDTGSEPAISYQTERKVDSKSKRYLTTGIK